MWSFTSVCLSVCLYRVGAQNSILTSRRIKSKWKKFMIYCLDTLRGTKIWAKNKVCILCESSINLHQIFGRAYKNTFYLIVLLFLLTFVYSLSVCDVCNVIFNIFKCLQYNMVFFSNTGVFKWVIGQKSHPYVLCLGVTFQAAKSSSLSVFMSSHLWNRCDKHITVHLGHALFSFFSAFSSYPGYTLQ